MSKNPQARFTLIQKVVAEIKSKKISLRSAAKKYNLPRSTLSDHYNGKTTTPHGRKTVFRPIEEELLAAYAVKVAESFPLTRLDIRLLAKSYLDSDGRTVPIFQNNLPGEEWVDGFLKRSSNLQLRMAGNKPTRRAKRTAAQIQKRWENFKFPRKKVLAKEKQIKIGTGSGGLLKKCTPDLYTEDATVESLIQHSTNVSIQDVLDSDAGMIINLDGEDELRRNTYEIKNNTIQPTIVAYEIDSNETDMIPPSDEDFHAEKPLLQLQQESAQSINAEPRCNKRKRTTARQSDMLAKQEFEVLEMRKKEAKLRIEVQEELLKKARLETSAASMKLAYEEEILKIKLESIHEISEQRRNFIN